MKLFITADHITLDNGHTIKTVNSEYGTGFILRDPQGHLVCETELSGKRTTREKYDSVIEMSNI